MSSPEPAAILYVPSTFVNAIARDGRPYKLCQSARNDHTRLRGCCLWGVQLLAELIAPCPIGHQLQGKLKCLLSKTRTIVKSVSLSAGGVCAETVVIVSVAEPAIAKSSSFMPDFLRR